VLKVLEKRKQTTFNALLSTTQLERNQLEYSLDLLIENLLVREQTNPNNKTTYSITERGNRVLSFFSMNGVFSIPQ
jgi:predicted transcriptional regulator